MLKPSVLCRFLLIALVLIPYPKSKTREKCKTIDHVFYLISSSIRIKGHFHEQITYILHTVRLPFDPEPTCFMTTETICPFLWTDYLREEALINQRRRCYWSSRSNAQDRWVTDLLLPQRERLVLYWNLEIFEQRERDFSKKAEQDLYSGRSENSYFSLWTTQKSYPTPLKCPYPHSLTSKNVSSGGNPAVGKDVKGKNVLQEQEKIIKNSLCSLE